MAFGFRTEGRAPVVSEPDKSHRLGLSEAYHVANRWLTHVGLPPRAIEEPVDGVVELTGNGFHARIRIDAVPLPQGAVLALLRAVADSVESRLILWSVSDFTNGAAVFADTQGVALFNVTSTGDVRACNSHARLLMPAEALEPAFPGAVEVAAEAEPEPDPDEEIERDESGAIVWRDCPRCGATHHPRANFCAACGADLHARLKVIGPPGAAGVPAPSKLEDRGQTRSSPSSGDPVPQPRADSASLRCRTCGSHDIELIHPHR